MKEYIQLRENVKKLGKDNKKVEFWLKESTANKLIKEASDIKIEAEKLVLVYDNGSYISLVHPSHLIYREDIREDGDDYYWVLIHCGDYNWCPYVVNGERTQEFL